MITTQRLILRPWREEDAGDLYRYACDERVSRPGQWPRHESVEMSRDVIRAYFIPNPHTFAIALRATGEVIGCIGLVPAGCENYPVLQDEREVGYWIGHPHQGIGLATEALLALIGYCRDRLHLTSLLLTTLVDNHPSRRVAAKCGFGHIGNFTSDHSPNLAFRLSLQPQ